MKSASLNHVYRLVWSDTAQAFVAVAETSTARGKRGGVVGVLAALGLLGSGLACAGPLPTAGDIVAGTGSISQSGNHMNIHQTSDKMVTQWNSFDIGADASVRFDQPNTQSIALNRVVGGGNASQILGKLDANGQVWLLNPNGVVIGKGAQVNVGGLLASSLQMTDADFMAGKARLTGGANAGAVVNQGEIRAAQGSMVALIGPQVSNSGSISTPGGSTVMAAGDKVSLDFQGDGLVSVNVERGVLDALVKNDGHISADGGRVTLSARSADAAISSVVNNTGVIEAHSLVARNGRIVLDGDTDGGLTQVAGTLDVSSGQGKGGDIVVTGEKVALQGATLTADGAQGGGTIKVGGGWQGQDASVRHAQQLDVDKASRLQANATVKGDGGTVVAWSDQDNRFAGRVAVRGGEQGGDGGKAEVSGKQTLRYDGATDARASQGRTGDLLLDPTNITVSGGSGVSGDWSAGSGDITVYEKTLEAQAANVLMTATGIITFADLLQNGGDGTITMQDNVSLRVEAGNRSNSNSAIRFDNANNTIEVSGTGSLYFQSGGTGTGSISNVANLIAHGAGANPDVAALPVHNVNSAGSGTPGAGSITLLGADGLTIAGSLTTHGGYVRLSSDSDNGGRGALTIDTPINTHGGNLYLSFGTTSYPESIATLNGDVTLGSGRLYFGDAMGASALGGSTGEKRLGGLLSLSGDVNFTTPLTMLGGASIHTDGNINFSSTVKLDTGDRALTLRATNIDFTQARLQNVSTASIALEPWLAATNIALDGTDGIATADTLGKLDNIRNLTIGRTDGTGITTVNSSGFSFNANNNLTLLNGELRVDGALRNSNATGHVIGKAGVGDVVIGTGGSVQANGSGDAVVLAAARNFYNNAGANALLSTNSAGRWLTYSTSPQQDIRNGLAVDFKQYNTQFGDTIAQASGNGHIYKVAPVVKVGLTGEVRKTYDGNNQASLGAGNYTSTGAIDGDQVDFVIAPGGNAVYDDKQAGVGKNVSATGIAIGEASNGQVKVYGYQLESDTASADIGVIDKRKLALSNGGNGAAQVSDKVYDGTRVAEVTDVAFDNLVDGDQLHASGNGAFSDKNAGNGKTVEVSGLQLLGADANNYEVDLTGVALTGQASITPKGITVGQVAVADKTYDGGRNASVTGIELQGVIAADQGKVAGHSDKALFADKNAGSNKAVVLSEMGLSGDEAGNYTLLDATANGVASIARKVLTGMAEVADKVYDGGTTATLGDLDLVGLVDGDEGKVTSTGNTGAFVDKNAGSNKSVIGSGIALTGEEARNYSFDTTAEIGKANIDRKVLTGKAEVANKVYDGGTTAQLSDLNLVGVVDGDQGKVTGTGTTGAFVDKNAGTGKTVIGSGVALTGDEARNYRFDTAAEIGKANIDRKVLTGKAEVASKVYDGGTTAQLSDLDLIGVVDGDEGKVTGTGTTGAFADKNAGIGKTVTGSGVALTGEEAGNYSFDTTAEIGKANIDRKVLTGKADVANKVYDGGITAQVSDLDLVGVVDGDEGKVTGTGTTGAFVDKNAGINKSVIGSGIALSGEEAGNYRFDTTAEIGKANIDRKVLTGKAEVANKVYDGGITAQLSDLDLVGVVNGDEGKVTGTGTTGAFVDKNAGTNKSVVGSGIALSGEEAGNYSFDTTAEIGKANIDRKVLTGKADVANKVYDGGITAQLSELDLVGVVDGDEGKVTGTGTTGAFVDKNAGTNKSVVGSGIALSGEESGNYNFDTTAEIGRANIDRKVLTGKADVANKVYDGGTSAQLSDLDLVGVVDGDEGKVTGTGTTGAFVDKNAGTNKSVTGVGVALTGEESGNYSFDTTAEIGKANIDRKVLTGKADVANKVYDGSTTAQLSDLDLVGVVDGDEGKVTGTGTTGAFVDKNAGTQKTVIGSGVALTGEEAGNYSFDTTAEIGKANIDRKVLTGKADVANKVYDGGTTAQLSDLDLIGVVDGDEGKVTGTGTTGAFVDKNAGTNKSVTGAGVALTGEEAGNYSFDTTVEIGKANIDRKVLTGKADVANKTYDGTTTAQLSDLGLIGVVDGDEGKVTGTGTTGAFVDKNAGTHKSVTGVGVALAGEEAGNYSFDTTAEIGEANIDRKVLTGKADVANKTYDGTTTAQLSDLGLIGVVDGDEGKVTGTGTTGAFVDKNAGTQKSVTGSGVALTGEESGNYSFDTTAEIGKANIDRKVLTGKADVANKTYDGTTTAQLSDLGLIGVVDGDEGKVTGTGTTGAFVDKNAGTNKSVVGSGIALSGEEAGNYSFDTTAEIGKANIDRKVLTGKADVANKTYDGTTTAQLSDLGLIGVVDGDEGKVTGTGTTGAFVDKNAGTNKSVTGAGVALTGEEAGNYSFDTTAEIGKANIDRKVLTGTADVTNKVYDGTTLAQLGNVGLVGVVDGDKGKVTGGGNSGSFVDRNAGTNKSVTGSGIVLAGEEAGNYSFDTTAEIGKANIDRKLLTGTADVADKVYDGNTVAHLGNISLIGILDIDMGKVDGTGTIGAFVDKNAGTNKSVTGAGVALTGEQARNYSFDTTAEIGKANIDRKLLTGTADVADKVYDGNTVAQLGNVGLIGLVDGDQDKVVGAGNTGAFVDKQAGTDKSVSGSGIVLTGEEAGNYSFDTTASIGRASITPKTLGGTVVVGSRPYDGSTQAPIERIVLDGVIGGDTVSASGTGHYATAVAGSGKPVSVAELLLSGADAGNYRIDPAMLVGEGVIEPVLFTPVGLITDAQGANGTALFVERSDALVADQLASSQQVANRPLYADATSATFDGRDAQALVLDTPLRSHGRLSLALADQAPEPTTRGTLGVFNLEQGDRAQLQGRYRAADLGNSITLESTTDAVQAVPDLSGNHSAWTRAEVRDGNGTAVTIQVMLFSNGTLRIDAPVPAAAVSDEELASQGLAVAKLRLKAGVAGIRAVLIERSARQGAVPGGTHYTVAQR
ncbi:filamentous hemagglutinin N-terminal domain-containing protein [Pseudomonas sp. SGAir0191]|uniref:YDG domain-containing protein n=1 Tax=Pseudomonas sp. SGAir0191 TaxID=2217867 RepID=UPI000C2C3C23|nr:YDG domain-containing protein [Pseudomonas sp. SGAir0191]AUA34561.1 filamentous hemagglutinin N-terminal domain-containing protein [Pseudomonas sp. SGAir0191]